jgi:transcriptional regulator with XRE-family HTH domain
MRPARRQPLSEAYARLGAELRRVRHAAGTSTRAVSKAAGGFHGSGHIANVEGGYTAPSLALIKAYARLGGRYVDLVTLLDRAKVRSAPSTKLPDEFDRELSNPLADPLLLRRGYVFELQDDVSFYRADRVPSKNIYTLSIRLIAPQARFFVLRYGYEADPRRGVATLQPGSGCTIAHLEEGDDGLIYVVLEIDRSKPDEFGRHNFSYVISLNTEEPGEPAYSLHSRSAIQHVVKRLQFEPPAVPERVWWYRGDDPFTGELPPKAEQIIETNSVHYYYKDFYNVENESCGLRWQWRDSK